MLKIQNNNTTSPQNSIKMLRADRCLESRFASGDILATNLRIWFFFGLPQVPAGPHSDSDGPGPGVRILFRNRVFLFSGNGNDY
jgi:hypothetical protein